MKARLWLTGAAALLAVAVSPVDALTTDDPALGQRTLGLTRAQPAPDAIRPEAHVRAPRYASDTGRGPHFKLRISGEDRGSGLAGVTLETRRNSNAAIRWRRLRGAATARTLRFPGKPGDTHSFRARARDRFGNFSRYAYASTTVPLDDRSPRLRFSHGWRRIGAGGAYRRGLRRTTRPGATLRLRFRGDRVALIARRTPGAGSVRVELAGRARTVSLRGRTAARKVIYRSRSLGPRIHRITVTAVGGGPVNMDAVATEQGAQLQR